MRAEREEGDSTSRCASLEGSRLQAAALQARTSASAVPLFTLCSHPSLPPSPPPSLSRACSRSISRALPRHPTPSLASPP